MDRTLITLEVPAVGESFEVMIPPTMPMRELATLLGKSVEEMTEGRYRTSGEEILCTRYRDGALSDSLVAHDYGIQNGEILLLV